ncbi:MAG: hypothetical protein EA424_00425 [Planctomycetaceae bacterium]|nr:MAG: hypothetical protein EA424_00425 [Planctomycetaceae bacterium]
MLKIRFVLAVFVASFCAVGCGGPEDSGTYQLTGTVSYQGAVVPNGNITLIPNHVKGNRGPGASAAIKGGKFATSPGKGHVGGAYILEIMGYDGVPVPSTEDPDNIPTPLFPPYRLEVELPKENEDLSVEVPAQ